MSVRLKLTIIFLAIAVIPLIFVSALTFRNYKHSLEAARLADLQNIVAFKADKIETYFAGLKACIEITQGFYNIKKNLPVLIRLNNEPNNQEYIDAKKMLNGQLQQMQSVLSGLTDIMLVNPEGMVVYAHRPNHYSKNLSNGLDAEQKAFKKGKDSVYFSDVYFDKAEDNKHEMLLTAPATDFNGVFIGVIAFELDMKLVYTILQDVTGLGDTGEVLVGKKAGNHVIYLNPLRHDAQAALKRTISFNDKAGGPIQEAVQGRQGAGQLLDYRGKQVIAAWRYIPSMDWGMVAKIDTEEAFADVTKLRNLALLISVIIFILSGILAFSIAHSISEPLNKLSQGAAIIGSGNLDYNLEIRQKDEIGQLARAFNKMGQDLKKITASRDELDREITERKKAEEELTRSNRDLEQFAYVASHDLQEPLRIVTSYVQLLQKRYKGRLDETADKFIAFAVDASKRMHDLINDLLEFSRIGTQGKAFERIDCNATLQQAVKNLAISIQDTGAEVTHDPLPMVMADNQQLIQLFQNLINNAIKFRGQEKPRIHVAAEKRTSDWLFVVRDNGIGIAPEFLERIFIIFQRLHGREKYPGTGIGLAICKRIVEHHGGCICAESEPGKGAQFYFTIPEI
jgi:signal transduction histidine kinase